MLVTAPASWQYGSELGKLVLGLSRLDTPSAHLWQSRADVPLGPDDRPDQKKEDAYDLYIAGKPVVETVRRALAAIR